MATTNPYLTFAGNCEQAFNFHIYIPTFSDEDTDRLFNDLSAGGQVTMPLQETHRGARFGMLVDPSGIRWMVNQDIGNQQKE